MEPTSSDNEKKGTGPAGPEPSKPRRAKPPIEIDLPASSVRSESEPSPDPAPETPVAEPAPAASEPKDPPRPSRLLPAMIGLVAGLFGGFGAWHVTGLVDGGVGKLTQSLDQRLARLEQARPLAALPADLAERLARAERFASESQPREQALRAELAKLQAALAALPERLAP